MPVEVIVFFVVAAAILVPIVLYALARYDINTLREQAKDLRDLAESEQMAHAACHKIPCPQAPKAKKPRPKGTRVHK